LGTGDGFKDTQEQSKAISRKDRKARKELQSNQLPHGCNNVTNLAAHLRDEFSDLALLETSAHQKNGRASIIGQLAKITLTLFAPAM
jgi:hypothetical protein